MKVKVAKVMYYDNDSMYGIFGCVPVEYTPEIEKNKYGNFSLKGNCRRLSEGEEYTIEFEGAFPDTKFGNYYSLIKVVQEKMDTLEAQHKFLRAIVSQNQFDSLVGAYPKEMIVDLILNDEIDVNKTKGIKAFSLSQIKSNIIKNKEIEELIVELESINITAKAIQKIVAHYGTAEKALHAVRTNIYSLCDVSGFGFKKVDGFALERGEDPKGYKRTFYALKYVLENAAQQGHTWIYEEEAFQDVNGLLDLYSPVLREVITNVYQDEMFYVVKDKVSLRRHFKQEAGILVHLMRIRDSYEAPYELDIDNEIKNQEKLNNITYSDEQKLAIKEAIENGVYILNGKGGVGKTTIIQAILGILSYQSHAACALSGKASNLLTNKGLNGMTIHRLLGMSKETRGFAHTEFFPLSERIIVLDEASMVNVGLAHSLIQAVANGSKLIIVGDSGQLSGIGQGDMLRDLLATDFFAKRELVHVHRQAQDSGILDIANRIREGEQITAFNGSDKSSHGINKDQLVITYKDRADLANDIRHVIDGYKGKMNSSEDIMNFQILVANRDKGDISAASINNYAQSVFNKTTKKGLKFGALEFKETDKVMAKGNVYKTIVFKDIEAYEDREYFETLSKRYEALRDYEEDCIQNDIELTPEEEDDLQFISEQLDEMKNRIYKEDLFNGTLGIIKKVNLEDKTLLIEFENIKGLVIVEQNNLGIIDLAYCMTIHKSQGSTIKTVIVAIDFVAFKLLTRQLIYTGITRASEKCILLAENNALHQAIDTDNSGNRQTFLAGLIRGYQQKLENDARQLEA